MLKVFRDNLKYLSWILWVVIGLFVLFVFVDFGSGVRQRGSRKGKAAQVGKHTVTMEEFERQYRYLDGMYRQLYGEQFTPELAQMMKLPMQALDRAVNEQILLDEAERLGLQVTDEELRAKILEEPAFKDQQGRFVGEEKYAQILQGNRYTVASFENEMRRQILREKLNDVLRASLFVSDKEVEEAYRQQVEKAKIRYLQLPRVRFAQEAQVTPAEVQAYFDAHKQEYKLPEQREGAYILIEPDKLRSEAKLSDDELRKYYDEHPTEFARPEQVRVRHILLKVNDQRTEAQARQQLEDAKKKIQAGADFAALAAQLSEDEGSKVRGGDLDFFGPGQMVKPFSDAAFGAKTGELVGPVRSEFGVHLLQVTDRRTAGVTPFAEAKEQINTRLSFDRVKVLAESRARDLASQLAKDRPDSVQELKAIADRTPGATFGETGKFSERDAVRGLGYAPALTSAAFGLEKGKISQPIEVPRGWALFYLGQIHEPRIPDLADVQDRVRAALVAQKQQEASLQRLKAARTEGKTLDQIAAELGLQVQETPEFGAQGTIPGIGYNPELAKAVMALQPGQMGGPVADTQGAVLFEVKERKSWDPIQFAAARQQTRETVEQQKMDEILTSLIQRRKEELGVEYDRQLLESFGAAGQAANPTPS